MQPLVKFLIVLLSLLSTSYPYAQDYSKKDFIETYWFTNNLNDTFFNTDTILLIKHVNKGPTWAYNEFSESEISYLKHGNYLNFGFNKFRQFEYWKTYNNYMNTISFSKFNWKFDKKKKVLKVYKDKELFFLLMPISNKTINIKSKFAGDSVLLQTEEWTFVRIE